MSASEDRFGQARRNAAALFAFLALLILTGAVGYYTYMIRAITADRHETIAAIGSLKARELARWTLEQKNDVRRAAESPFFVDRLLDWRDAPETPGLRDAWKQRLELERDVFQYADVLIYWPSGERTMSARDTDEGLHNETKSVINEALSADGAVLSDIYRQTDGTVLLDVAQAVRDADGAALAVLVSRTDAGATLFPIVRQWPTPSPTAEAFLAVQSGNEAIIISNLRHHPDPALMHRFPMDQETLPAVQALLGREGIFEGVDYRGKRVLADLHAVEGTPWVLVSKIDFDEIYAEARYRTALLTVLSVLALMLALAVSTVGYRRNQATLYETLYENERAEREAREMFRATLYSIGDAVITTDAKGSVFCMNPVAETLTGWPEAEAAGRPLEEVFRIVNESTGETVENPAHKVLQDGKIVGLANHTLLIARDGALRPIADSGAPITDGENGITGVVLVFRDQTEEREREDRLRESEELFRSVFNQQFQFMAVLDPQGRIIAVNDLPLQIRGICREDVLGTLFWETPWWEGLPDMQAAWPERLRQAAETKGPLITEDRFRDAAGEVREADAATTAVFDTDGTLRHYIVQATDTTERRRAERKLKESEYKLKNAHRIAHLGNWELDIPSGKLVWSEEVHAIFGIDPGTFAETFDAFLEYVPEEDRPEVLAVRKRTLLGQATLDFDHRIQRPDGAIRHVQQRCEVVPDNAGQPALLLGTMQDITERKEAELALHEVTTRYQGVLHHSPLLITEIDLDGRYLLINKAACDVFGVPAEAIVGKSCFDLLGPEATRDFQQRMDTVIQTRAPLQVEDRFTLHDGDHFYSTIIFPRFGPDGTITSIGGIAHDNTERVRADAERATLEAQLRQAQKMEAVGRLAGGVAHDFNNMLGVILGNAEIALAQLGPDDPLHDDLAAIAQAANRSAALTNQLLAFARKQAIAPKVLDINDTVADMIGMLRRLISEDIDLRWKPGEVSWPVLIDPAQIDQLLVNLVLNARDAIVGHGTIAIESGAASFDEETSRTRFDVHAGDYVRISVSDTGCGMDQNTLSQLFEPFFTTKPQGKGTGLGLAMVHGIVSQNNGFINVYSEPGAGSAFNIYLPRHTETAPRHEEPGPAEEPRECAPGSRTILFVEDEEPLLLLGKRLLERAGYAVIPVSRPKEALDIVRKHDGDIDLLITDVIMPGMSGRQVWEQLRAVCPDLRCIFISGYTADVIADQGVLEEGIHFLQKPFTGESLAQKVRQALNEG